MPQGRPRALAPWWERRAAPFRGNIQAPRAGDERTIARTVPVTTDALELAVRVGRALVGRKWTIATAESCTGGLIAGAITDVAGSSAWFDRGFVTYSNAAKIDMLGVRPETLAARSSRLK